MRGRERSWEKIPLLSVSLPLLSPVPSPFVFRMNSVLCRTGATHNQAQNQQNHLAPPSVPSELFFASWCQTLCSLSVLWNLMEEAFVPSTFGFETSLGTSWRSNKKAGSIFFDVVSRPNVSGSFQGKLVRKIGGKIEWGRPEMQCSDNRDCEFETRNKRRIACTKWANIASSLSKQDLVAETLLFRTAWDPHWPCG